MNIHDHNGRPVALKSVVHWGIINWPSPKHRRAIPYDELKLDSFYDAGCELSDLKRILDLNPGALLFAHIGEASSGFWIPVELKA